MLLCSDKIQTCAENPASPERFLRATWDVGLRVSPQFDAYGLFLSTLILSQV